MSDGVGGGITGGLNAAPAIPVGRFRTMPRRVSGDDETLTAPAAMERYLSRPPAAPSSRHRLSDVVTSGVIRILERPQLGKTPLIPDLTRC
jgi:hypothetical protein